MKLCFESSGEHPTLPQAELSAVIEAVTRRKASATADGDAFFVNVPGKAALEISERLALFHYASEVIAESSQPLALSNNPLLEKIHGERVKVRARIVSGDWSNDDRESAERSIGGVVSEKNSIDLRNPTVELRVILGGKARLCGLVHSIDRKGFEARKGENRPFFSPVSLHPKYARTLVNLSRIRKGEKLVDPFCGTGGILIEAAMIGARTSGGDVDQRMLEGSKWNLAHFGLGAEKLANADVSAMSKAFGKVDAIATDPPYGRASYTAKEKPLELHVRMLGAFHEALKPGGHAAVILPNLSVLEKLPKGLKVVESHPSRVHRSLVRHFVVLRKVR